MKGYRTLIFNGIGFAILLARFICPDCIAGLDLSDEAINGFLDALDKVVSAGLVVGNVVLRVFLTTTSVTRAKC